MEQDLSNSQESEQTETEQAAGEQAQEQQAAQDISGTTIGYETSSGGFQEIALAVTTGLAAAAVFLICYFIGNIALLILITAVIGVATIEFLTALKRVKYEPAILLGLISTVGLSLGVYWRGEAAYPILLALAIFFVTLWYLLVDTDKSAIPNISVSLFGIAYIGILGSTATLLLAAKDDYGPNLLLTAVIAAVSYDVGGWLIGKSIGRIKITSVSPNKTLEGLIGGMLATVIIMAVLLPALSLEPFGDSPGELKDILILGIVAAIVAPLGDLIESKLKRNLNIKDMGTLLPGHGGILDRIDTLLFIMPATLIVARFLDLAQFS